MTDDRLNAFLQLLTPENRRWVEQLPNQEKSGLVQEWSNISPQESYGLTSRGPGVAGEAESSAAANDLVNRHRQA